MALGNQALLEKFVNKMKEQEHYINVIEEEVSKHPEEVNIQVIALAVGKIMKNHEEISFLAGVYDGKQKYK